MSDETEIRPGGEDHAGDVHGERAGEQSPLQGRAAFIKNWDWQLVNSLNRGSCDRGKAQYGHNKQTHTLKGSARGVIVRFLPDGRVAWLPDGTQSELLALPETLLLDKQGGEP